ncbi:sterol carrier family protein [Micromonospora sp. DT4]|uniref:sterol carrier family protein n=1 Tax=Micromonospora sp. DT4 TaxID=3393438 RepID=UPI003CFA4A60
MSSPHNKSTAVVTALAALDEGRTPERSVLREAVRSLLAVLAERAPGRSVEVRVPPYGAIQCAPGPRHTRGNPPNVVEMSPRTWLELATGRLGWAEAVAGGRVQVSGVRADISAYLPL